jgi:WD40 repeat protein
MLWDYRNEKEVMQLAANDCGINDLAVSPDGRMLASAHRDRSIRFWDLRTGQLMATIAEGVGWVKTLAYAPDGRRIAFGGQSGVVQFLKLDEQSMPEGAGRSVKLG